MKFLLSEYDLCLLYKTTLVYVKEVNTSTGQSFFFLLLYIDDFLQYSEFHTNFNPILSKCNNPGGGDKYHKSSYVPVCVCAGHLSLKLWTL